jgi:predicted dithiol-disulfide oxidoreductase (DUF899 family)
MKLTKDLVHAIDFKTAPAEVKAAAKNYTDSAKRLRRAQEQQAKWRDELKKATADAEHAFETLNATAEKWNPSQDLEVI